MLQSKNKLGFTLVELIVVITILAILGTIAFITLQGYGAQARDSKRLSDIQNIKKSLELFSLNTGKYPLPDNGKEVIYESDLVWTQGIVGNNVTKNLSKNLNALPLDPKSELEYTYSLINSGNKYELLSIYETDLISQNKLINSSFAANSNYQKIDGTYNGIFVKTNAYYIPLPSLITSENINSGLTLNGENIKSQIISGGKNKIKVGLSGSNTGELNIKLVAYTGSITNESEDLEKKKLAEIIQKAYTGGSLANKGVYKKILETTQLEEIVSFVNNVVLNSANVSSASKDTEAPIGGDFTIPSTTNSVNVELNITCPEEEGTQMQISGNIVGTVVWETCTSSKNIGLTNEEGDKNISIKFKDSIGNETQEISKTINYLIYVCGDLTNSKSYGVLSDNKNFMFCSGTKGSTICPSGWSVYTNKSISVSNWGSPIPKTLNWLTSASVGFRDLRTSPNSYAMQRYGCNNSNCSSRSSKNSGSSYSIYHSMYTDTSNSSSGRESTMQSYRGAFRGDCSGLPAGDRHGGANHESNICMSLGQYNYSSGSKYKASSLTSVHGDNTVEITSAANGYQQAYYIMKNIYGKTIFKHVNRGIPHICVK